MGTVRLRRGSASFTAEKSIAETVSSISTDLSRLVEEADGYVDEVHTLRDRYGSDIVTLLGAGYADGGACGIGYLMSSVSTSFARHAFNVVDQSCAAGHLSYAHEVGHNQGLQHDPANGGWPVPPRIRLPMGIRILKALSGR